LLYGYTAQERTTMKETFVLLAEYNATTNGEVLEILRGVPAEDLDRNLGSFFGSILGIMNHILVSDVAWLRRFSTAVAELAQLEQGLPRVEVKKLTDVIWPDLGTFSPVRQQVDTLIMHGFQVLPEERFTAVLRYRNWRGEEQEKIAWKAFLHFFNHQTHHRGQVSALLDRLSVKNDYSNLIWKF
jgi:uncharacterized damage-inducible protein DinB